LTPRKTKIERYAKRERDDTRDEDRIIRETKTGRYATVKKFASKTKLRDNTNGTIHDDRDSAIRESRSETVRDNKTEQYARNGAGRYATENTAIRDAKSDTVRDEKSNPHNDNT